jgi:isopropylmalate/homocitrate/citramalate synthase
MKREIKILDITLRDGMYAVSHQMMPDRVAKLAAGIDTMMISVEDTVRYAQMSESFGAQVVYLLDGGGYMLPHRRGVRPVRNISRQASRTPLVKRNSGESRRSAMPCPSGERKTFGRPFSPFGLSI